MRRRAVLAASQITVKKLCIPFAFPIEEVALLIPDSLRNAVSMKDSPMAESGQGVFLNSTQ